MDFFVNSLEWLEEMDIKYNLEDCGESGQYIGYHWYRDDEQDVNVYFRLLHHNN